MGGGGIGDARTGAAGGGAAGGGARAEGTAGTIRRHQVARQQDAGQEAARFSDNRLAPFWPGPADGDDPPGRGGMDEPGEERT